MEHDQLIKQAKTHLAGTVSRETTPPKPEDFRQVYVRDAALVHFEKKRKPEHGCCWIEKPEPSLRGGQTGLKARGEASHES